MTWETIDVVKSSLISGTTIIIVPREGEDVECPTFDSLSNKINNHFALRDILSNGKRKVTLIMTHSGYKKDRPQEEIKLKYNPLSGHQIENKKLYLNGFGICSFKLYESNERLNYSRHDPCSSAGILIKSANATLDNQLFGFDNDPNAHYFFGEVYSPGIAEKVKTFERGLIRPDRTGLNWRHQFCRELEKEIKRILSHHIERKRKQDEVSKVKPEMPAKRAEKIKKLVKKLNKLSKQLIGDHDLSGEGGLKSDLDILKLTLYPAEASASPKEDRIFTVYNTAESLKNGEAVNILLDEPKGKFSLSASRIILKKHKKVRDLVIGHFKIRGYKSNDKTGILVTQGSEEDISEFTVGPPRKKPVGLTPPKGSKGGLFKDIIFDDVDKSPIQREYYNRKTGIVRIYIYFPGIAPFLRENGEGSESAQGSILLSEIIAEAFCKETARMKVDKDFYGPEGQLDKYLQIYNEHLRLCIPIIHNIWMN